MFFGTALDDQKVTAACGLCIFGVPSNHGCYWSVEWDGEFYPVHGPAPGMDEHDAHGPEGMCTMPRQAVVSGRLRKGKLYADAFELLPVDPNAPKLDIPVHEHVH
jgi:hypothetical protein